MPKNSSLLCQVRTHVAVDQYRIHCTEFIHDSKGTIVTLSRVAMDRIEVSTYTVPTDFPESDGTLEWNSTTLVVVHSRAGNEHGVGYTYADTATAKLIHDLLSEVVKGCDALAPVSSWNAMVSRTRNLGRPGVVSMAISASILHSGIRKLVF